MELVVSPTSESPIYQQIYDQICSQIIKGELPSQTCLPSIRTVAKELRISVITVKRAWEELERDGFIYTMAGKGCFVAALHESELERMRKGKVLERLEKDMEYYRSLGIAKDELIDFIERHYEE